MEQERKILEIKDRIETCLIGSDNSSELDKWISYLKNSELESEVILKTKIGTVLNKLRKEKNIDPKILLDITKILEKWKTQISNKSKSETDSDSLKVANTKFTTIREKCRSLLKESFGSDEFSDEHSIESLVVEIEKKVWENERESEQAYKKRINTIYLNIKRNCTLKIKLLEKEITPEILSTMNTEEMISDEQKIKDHESKKRNFLSAQIAKDNDAETDQFKCSKCHQRRCKYYQLQTRSADEPMTTFVSCVNCGNRWKFC